MKLASLVLYILILSLGLATATASAKAKNNPGKDIAELKTSNSKSEKDNELNALKAEVLISKSEEKAIEQINILLKKYKGTQMEPDLLFRLAELYMRRAKTDRFLEFHRNSDAVVRFAPKMIRQVQSKKSVLKAIAIYSSIQKKYPQYEKIDFVVFNNAFANQQIGIMSSAEKLYTLLVNNYKYSSLMPDAYLALGEMQFDNRKFSSALNSFHAIRKYPESTVYPYGLYKAAWAQYNLRDAETGLKELEDVIKYGKFVKEKGIDSRLDLRKEALLDMALFYEDVRPSEKAYKYLSTQAGELDVSPVILRLSKLYKRHSRYNYNITILTDFLKQQTTSNYVPIAYVELMDSNEKIKNRNEVVVLLDKLFGTCDSRSQWSQAQNNESLFAVESPLREYNEEKVKKITASEICQIIFEKNAISYANKWHKMWLRTPSELEIARAAEKAFALYLSHVPASDASGKARFVYADILFKLEKYRQASQNYAQSVLETKDVKIAHDGRYYAIFSLEKAVKNKWNDEDEKLFKKLSDDYLLSQPKGQYALDVEFKIALVAYEKTRYVEAAPIFVKIGKNYPNTDKGIKSQDLYLDILNIQKNYKQLKEYSNQLRTASKDLTRKAKLTKIYEDTYFLLVQDLEKTGDWKKAVREYQFFAKENSASPMAEKSLWNVIQLLYKFNEPLLGAEASLAYHAQHKGTKEGIDALKKAAQTYESLAQLDRAAQVVFELSVEEPHEAKNWLKIAADFYLLDNKPAKAKPIYEKIKKTGKPANVFHALVQLKEIAEKENNKKQFEIYLAELLQHGTEPAASDALLFFIKKDVANKNWTAAFDKSKKIIAAEKRGASNATLAEARLVQARILAQEFKNQSVKSQLSRLELVLQLKTEKLQKAQIAYQSAAQYGVPSVAVTAYRELADCYLHYSEALKNMPMPAGIADAEVEVFKTEIDKLAMPMEEQGMETKMQALKAAREYHTGDVTALEKEVGAHSSSAFRDLAPRGIEPAVIFPKLNGKSEVGVL